MSEMVKPADDRPKAIGRREFAFSTAGVLGLSAVLPLSALGTRGSRGSADPFTVLEEVRISLPGGGERRTATVAHDMLGFKGETTVIQDMWPTDVGNVSHIYWTASPAIEGRTGEAARQCRIKRTVVFGSDVDHEYRNVTITNEATTPGQGTVVTEWKAKQRIRMVELTGEDEQAVRDRLQDQKTLGKLQTEKSLRHTGFANTIDFERIR